MTLGKAKANTGIIHDKHHMTIIIYLKYKLMEQYLLNFLFFLTYQQAQLA
jgi:hypothetical protein